MQQSKNTTKALEEGIEVIIRIRPIFNQEEDQTRCVSMSDCEENTIVVETNNKKQLFSFDHIASQQCGQQELYQRLGHPVLLESLKGYNCCVFSYGQTGAGKTYSILGQPTELMEDPFSQSRGILPRLLQELFSMVSDSNNGFQQINISCSYLEIYNEQIIDLLTKQSRNLTIREDLRRGVFIDGLTELSIRSYEDVLGIIAKGLTIRKTAATFMNSESSRSHTIFTMLLNLEYFEGEVRKSLRSKLHIVDLAGSERIKLAKVEGERLKQGCNINKSLLTLSHVISSLVQSGKKKKHIPFRDSKLTFFLKDSLGGNSKTKLLANISPKISYIGDTISTLMFAKRAKIIKSKVEPNENIADNFQSLRTEIRKLREELAQTKFIQTLPSSMKSGGTTSKVAQSVIVNKDVFLPTESFIESNCKSGFSNNNHESMKIFEQNQNSYRVIVQHCIARLKQYGKGVTVKYNFKTLFDEKKSLEKTLFHQQKLIANFPAFTKLFNQNIQCHKKVKLVEAQLTLCKQQVQMKCRQITNLENTIEVLGADIEHMTQEIAELSKPRNRSRSNSNCSKKKIDTILEHPVEKHHPRTYISHRTSKLVPEIPLAEIKNRRSSLILTKRGGFKNIVERQNNIIDEYQYTIQQIKKNFEEILIGMKNAYETLEQMYQEEKRQKHEICKRKRKQPEMQAITNENQYLKLNIMQLEAEILKLQQDIFKRGVEIKTSRQQKQELEDKLKQLQKRSHENGIKESELQLLIEKVNLIKIQAEKANQELNDQLEKDAMTIYDLENKLSKQTKQNYALLSKNQLLTQQANTMKNRLNEIVSLDQSVILFKEGMEGPTFDESTVFEQSLHEDMIKDINKLTFERDKLVSDLEQSQRQITEQTLILQKASFKILNLTKEMNMYKQTSLVYGEQVRELAEKLDTFEKDDKKYFEKTRILEVDLTRLRKENEKNQYVVGEIIRQFHCEPIQFIQEVKLSRSRNQTLINQNKRLQEIINDFEKKTTLIKNSKSLSSLTTVRELVGASLGKASSNIHSKQSGPASNRQSDNPMKKKQTKKGLFSTFQQQKQKASIQFKSPKPLTQQSLNRFKKNIPNK